MTRRVVGSDERDAYGGWRGLYRWKPGQLRRIKRRTHKCERRETERVIAVEREHHNLAHGDRDNA